MLRLEGFPQPNRDYDPHLFQMRTCTEKKIDKQLSVAISIIILCTRRRHLLNFGMRPRRAKPPLDAITLLFIHSYSQSLLSRLAFAIQALVVCLSKSPACGYTPGSFATRVGVILASFRNVPLPCANIARAHICQGHFDHGGIVPLQGTLV
jgi:hypothetical protein